MKFSKAEWAGIFLTAGVLAFFSGWYARGTLGQDAYTVAAQRLPQSPSTAVQTFVPEHVVDLNSASFSDLLTLPGIGETRAQAILDYRTDHGPFQWPEDLTDVPGIGQSVYERLAPYVTTASQSPAPSSE